MHKLAASVALFSGLLAGQDLSGVIDLHAHCDPDNTPRSMDAIELAKLAREHGLRAIVLKNHHDSTAPLAYLVRKQVPGIEVFGGVVLNRAVGGINPVAVTHMASLNGGFGRIVWMPTADAENHVRSAANSGPNPASHPFVQISRNGDLLPEVKQVIALIARYKLVLATGHSSAAENLLLVREGRRAGVPQIVVTHAMIPPVDMTIAQMQEAAGQGAYIEFVYNALLPPVHATIEGYSAAMRAVGPEHCVISSDLGRAGNPTHTDGLQAFIHALLQQGFTAKEVDQMSKTNPARVLGLRP